MKQLGALLLAVSFGSAAPAAPPPEVKIGSKQFTESVVLAEIVADLVRSEGGRARHQRQMGGTRILWSALQSGQIDAYPEYTGTIAEEILAGQGITTVDAIAAHLRGLGIEMTRPLGFDNTYVLGMKRARAVELGIRRISDLLAHPDLRLGFSNEFMDRGDGWPALRDRYRLPHQDVRGLQHDLAYRAVDSGTIDVMDLYATDAEIAYYDLLSIEDDLHHFPEYQAIVLYRSDLAARFPSLVPALRRLEGSIQADDMVKMNARAKLAKVPEAEVAADFVNRTMALGAIAATTTRLDRLWMRTGEHLALVALSLLAAVVLAIPLGIAAFRFPRLGHAILGGVGIVQTIPALALLVFMIPLLGIGFWPSIAALFLYSLLPVVRNTHAGLTDITPSLRESAEALGLPPMARLRLVELPLASRAILAGIKTSAVINIGTATLGALIGAGGYGQPILTGIRLDDVGLILEGAVPAALLAIVAQGLFELLERAVAPKGLRLGPP